MITEIFLDWCPLPTQSYTTKVYGDPGSPALMQGLRKCAANHHFPSAPFDEHVISIAVAYRIDGFFIFSIVWDSAEIDSELRLNVANIVSFYVKEKLNHVHKFNSSRESVVIGSSWAPTFKYPVQIDYAGSAPPECIDLENLLKKDINLANCLSAHLPRDTSSVSGRDDDVPESVPAILRVRQKYSAVFEKTIRWCKQSKDLRFPRRSGLYVYRSLRTYIATFVVSVFFWTACAFAIKTNDQININGIATAGLIMAVLAMLVLAAFFKLWDKLLKPVFSNVGGQVTSALRLPHLVKLLGMTRGLRFFPHRSNIYFFVFFTYIFGSAITFVPTFPEWAKPFKFSTIKPLLDNLERNWNAVSLGEVLAKQGFWLEYFASLAFYSPALICTVFLLDVRGRRRKVIGALVKLEAHLIYANILDKTIRNVFRRAQLELEADSSKFSDLEKTRLSKFQKTKHTDFTDALAVARMIRRIEETKRTESTRILAVLLILAVSFYVASFHSLEYILN